MGYNFCSKFFIIIKRIRYAFPYNLQFRQSMVLLSITDNAIHVEEKYRIMHKLYVQLILTNIIDNLIRNQNRVQMGWYILEARTILWILTLTLRL